MMHVRDSDEASITRFRSARASIVEAIVVVGVFAAGIGLLTSQMPANLPAWVLLILGTLFVGASVGYLWVTRIGNLGGQVDVSSFFVWDPQANDVIAVPGYVFAEEMSRYLRQALEEQSALRRQWDEDPLQPSRNSVGSIAGDTYRWPGSTKSGRIVKECVEYMLLERLSTQLTDYFNRPEFDSEKLVEYGRGDVADVIQGNRILDSFSRPIDDRLVLPAEARKAHADRTVVVAGGSGWYYSRFDMRLPRGSRLSRDHSGIVIIDSPVFKLYLTVDFDGFNAVLPFGFERDYLHRSERSVSSFLVRISVRSRIKRRAIVRRRDWAYFTWPDSLFKYLSDHWAAPHYFETIQWPVVRAILHATRSGASEIRPTDLKQADDT